MMNMEMVTHRMILRPWQESDAASLYQYARDPDVGSIAGWPPHVSEADSLQVIRTVFSMPETYAVVLKATEEAVGCVGMLFGDDSHIAGIPVGEVEVGYWIGKSYWGQGLIPEAVGRLLQRGFETLGLSTVWGGYYDGNERSRRVLEKCGFRFHHTEPAKASPLGDVRIEHFMRLTKTEWEVAFRRS